VVLVLFCGFGFDVYGTPDRIPIWGKLLLGADIRRSRIAGEMDWNLLGYSRTISE
jgi:hypothetical protein